MSERKWQRWQREEERCKNDSDMTEGKLREKKNVDWKKQNK